MGPAVVVERVLRSEEVFEMLVIASHRTKLFSRHADCCVGALFSLFFDEVSRSTFEEGKRLFTATLVEVN
jgi:hypothetical protein